MVARGVHDPDRARFFVELILRRAHFFSGIIKIGKRDRRFQNSANGVGVQQVGTELIAKLEGAVRCDLERLDVEIGASQDALGAKMIGDSERDFLVWVMQLNKRFDLNRTRTALRSFEVRSNPVNPQVEVRRIFHRAEAVVGYNHEAAVAVIRNRRKALHRLLVDERHGLAVDRRGAELLT